MKIVILALSIVFVISACTSNTNSVGASEISKNDSLKFSSPLETIRSRFLFAKENGLLDLSTESGYLLNKYSTDVINSIKVVDSTAIKGTNLYAVFYSYSIKASVNNAFCYMRKIDNTWRIHEGYYYYSEYSDKDPFKNGDGKAAKELLEKKSKWTEGDELFFLNIDK